MYYLDHSYLDPIKNLALDEAYLLTTPKEGVLRLWESDSYFVVLGASNSYHTECYEHRCIADKVPILRRCSGGGTILQGPGCLNFSLILPQSYHPDLTFIQSSNTYIMDAQREALSTHIPGLSINGYTDLSIGPLKVSGNAQRRSKTHLLFHGTFLYDVDIQKISYYLKMPSQEPTYRKKRTHADFLKNIPLSAETLKTSLKTYWKAMKKPPIPNQALERLIETKYSKETWHLKR